jgi:lipopolysaccharide/colanic/teichoic acid biosynthesis glycosyltransferase
MRVPSPTSRSGKRVYLSLWDLSWALASPILALYLRDASMFGGTDWGVIGYYWLLSASFALLAFFALRIQDGMTRYFSVHEALDIAEAVLFAELMTTAALFTLTRLDGIPRSMPLIHGLLLATGIIAVRMLVRVVFSQDDEIPDYRCRRERIILIGANPFAAAYIQLLRAYAPQRQTVIAVLDADTGMAGRAIAGVQVFGTPQELDTIVGEFAIHGVDTDRILVAGEVDILSPTLLHEVERICRKRQIDLCFLPRMIGITEPQSAVVAVHSEPLQEAPSFAPPLFFRVKRAIDIVVSLALMVLLTPVFIVAGVLVLFDVGSPVLFWQERLGWKGRSFLIYKFRTLRAPFDAYGKPALEGRKPSVIGRFLRATRIDELPQLFNVLLGDMSLIGPRPLLPEDQPANVSTRLSVRPGITGWAQVNGAKLVAKEDKEKLDEWYIQNASPGVEVRIILMTLKMMLQSYQKSAEAIADTEQVQQKSLIGVESLRDRQRRHA